jgi:hypothetical protein
MALWLLALASANAAAAEPKRIGGPSGVYPQAFLPGGLSQLTAGLAVSAEQHGAIYAADAGDNQRITEFQPSGAFVRSFGWNIVPGPATGSGDLVSGSTTVTNAKTISGRFGHGRRGSGAIITGTGIRSGTQIVTLTENTIELSKPATATGSGVALSVTPGPGQVAVNEVERLVVAATGGTYKLAFSSPNPGGATALTSAIAADASASELQAALEALPNLGEHGVSVSGGPGDAKGYDHPYLIEFAGKYADTYVRTLRVAESSLSGGSPASGVTVTALSHGGGALETCTTVCAGEGVAENELERGGAPGQGFRTGQFAYPDAIAVNNDSSSPAYGDLYVVDERRYRIERYGPSGEFQRMFGNDVIASGPGNSTNHTIQKLVVRAAAGTFRLSLRDPLGGGQAGERAETAPIPYNASASELEAQLDAIPWLGAEGAPVTVTGGPGDPSGSHPYEITFGGWRAGDDVPPLEPTEGAAQVETVAHGGGPEVCNPSSGDVCKVGAPGAGPAAFQNPYPRERFPEGNSVAVGPDGTVYVGDYRRVQEFGPEGEYEGQIDLPKAEFPNAGLTDSLAVDSESHVYAGSVPRNAVQHIVPPQGAFSVCFEGSCTPETIFTSERALQKELEELSTIGPNNVHVEEGGEPITIVFTGALARKNLPLLSVSSGSVEVYVEGSAGELLKLAGPKAIDPSEVLASLDPGGEPTHLALDSADDLFATDLTGAVFRPACSASQEEFCPEAIFRAFKPSGDLYSIFTSPQVLTAGSYNPFAIAVGRGAEPAPGKPEDLYVSTDIALSGPTEYYVAVVPLPVVGPPEVIQGSEQATNVEPTTATLHAVVNPKGFDTHYDVEYITEAQARRNEEEGKEAFEGASQTPLQDLGALIQEDHLTTSLSRLAPGTPYRWRIFAESHCHGAGEPACEAHGEAADLTTLPVVSVREFTTQTVGPELVTIKAELNPNNGIGTEYTIRYGTDAHYTCEAGNSCASHGKLPLGNQFESVSATFKGLKPNTTYHYQLLVRNSSGEEETEDQTFTTERSPAEELAAEDCPNGSDHGQPRSALREENKSLALPDCRAYEQVSEVHKEGGQVEGPDLLSPSGEHAAYTSGGVFAGAEQNPLFIEYLAERTESGWVTKPVVRNLAPPPTEAVGGIAIARLTWFSPELDRWLYPELHSYSLSSLESEPEESGYFSLGSLGGEYVLHASPVLAPLEGGPRGFGALIGAPAEGRTTSADLSRLYLPTGVRFLSTDPRPDGDFGYPGHPATGIPPEADRIYELSGLGGPSPSLRLAAEVPTGLTFPYSGSELGVGSCFINWDATLIGHAGRPRMTDESGSTLFYTAPIEVVAGYGCGERFPNPIGLFARTGEAQPVQLNTWQNSQCTEGHPCFESEPKTPLYDGASADGRYVWFTTTQPLVNEDTDETNDVYVATLSESGQLEGLTLVSAGKATATHPTPGEGAKVGEDGIAESIQLNATNQGLATISADGTHAAFESPAVLTEEPNALGQSAVQRANNLYVYDAAANKLRFVAELCSAPGRSGSEPGAVAQRDHSITAEESVPDPACPATMSGQINAGFAISNSEEAETDAALWEHSPNGGVVQMTPDGRFLLFASWGRLTSDDTDNARDIFRYDFETGQLTRVSIGRRGNDGNGNDSRFNVRFPSGPAGSGDDNSTVLDKSRAVSADGSTVIFNTAAPLVSTDTNLTTAKGACETFGQGGVPPTGCDLYEWEQQGHGTCTEPGGCVSLISNGREPNLGVVGGVIGSSGRDIVFRTAQGLVPADKDGVNDLYDARIEGGFHYVPPPPPCETPENCARGATPEPAPPTISTEHFVGPETRFQRHLECAKGKVRVIRHNQVRCVTVHRKRHRHGHRRAHRRGHR